MIGFYAADVIRVPRNIKQPIKTEEKDSEEEKAETNAMDIDEDAEKADENGMEEDEDEDPAPKAKARKRKPKKVVPVGRNGLKKKRVVKSRMTTDEKGYMGKSLV